MDKRYILAQLRLMMSDEGPGHIEYTNKHIWIGGSHTLEILDWAVGVDNAVRKHAAAEGAPLPGIDQPWDEYFAELKSTD